MIRKFLFVFGLVTNMLPSVSSSADNPLERDTPLAITGATLIDGTGRPPLLDSIIIVSRGKIEAAGKQTEIKIPTHARRIDARGKWIVPGLIDAHIHFFQSAGLYTRPDVIDLRSIRPYSEEVSWIRQRIPYTLSRYTCSGVTSVVDMGGPMWTLDLKQKFRDVPNAPQISATGPLLATYVPPELQSNDPADVRLGDPDHARKWVRKILANGADLVKIWFVTPENASSSMPSIRAVIAEAHAKGARVAVHATELDLAKMVVEAGADILVHSVSDHLIDPSFLQLLKSKNIIYIPTLMVSKGYREVLNKEVDLSPIEKRCGDPEVIATWKELKKPQNISEWNDSAITQENLRRVANAGIAIASGSDAGNIGTLHGPALHQELQLMVKAGLSPQQVLIAATRDAAKVTSPHPQVGTIEVGKIANLLILGADPTQDITHLSKIEKVIQNGQEV